MRRVLYYVLLTAILGMGVVIGAIFHQPINDVRDSLMGKPIIASPDKRLFARPSIIDLEPMVKIPLEEWKGKIRVDEQSHFDIRQNLLMYRDEVVCDPEGNIIGIVGEEGVIRKMPPQPAETKPAKMRILS